MTSAQPHLDQVPEKPWFWVIGYGSGDNIRWLRNRYPTSEVGVICMRTDNSISIDTAHHTDPHVVVIPFDPTAHKPTQLSAYNRRFCSGYHIMVDPAHQSNPAVEEWKIAIAESMNHYHAGLVASFVNDKRYWTNILVNIPAISTQHWSRWKRTIPPPIICVSAGPSLTHAIPLMQAPAVRKAVWILACDTSLPVLMDNGIIPDAIVTADPGHANIRHFTRHWDHLNIPIFLDPMANLAIVRHYPGPKIFYPISHPLLDYFNVTWGDDPPYRGISVAIITASIAAAAHPPFIGLVGYDFAYADNQGYAAGTAKTDGRFSVDATGQKIRRIRGVDGKIHTNPIKTVPGIDGPIDTDETLYTFLCDMNAFIHTIPAISIINCGSHGAQIAGTLWKSVESMTDQLARMQDAPPFPNFGMDDSGCPRVDAIITQAQTLIDNLTTLIPLVEMGQAACQRLHQSPESQSDQKIVNSAIDEITKDPTHYAIIEKTMSATKYLTETNKIPDPVERVTQYFETLSEVIPWIIRRLSDFESHPKIHISTDYPDPCACGAPMIPDYRPIEGNESFWVTLTPFLTTVRMACAQCGAVIEINDEKN